MNEDHVIFLPSRCLHLKFGAFLVLSWRRNCKGASTAAAPMQFRRLVAQDQESPWRPLLHIGCSTFFHSARTSMIDSSRTCSCHCTNYKYNLWRISIFACSTLRVDDRCRSRITSCASGKSLLVTGRVRHPQIWRAGIEDDQELLIGRPQRHIAFIFHVAVVEYWVGEWVEIRRLCSHQSNLLFVLQIRFVFSLNYSCIAEADIDNKPFLIIRILLDSFHLKLCWTTPADTRPARRIHNRSRICNNLVKYSLKSEIICIAFSGVD